MITVIRSHYLVKQIKTKNCDVQLFMQSTVIGASRVQRDTGTPVKEDLTKYAPTRLYKPDTSLLTHPTCVNTGNTTWFKPADRRQSTRLQPCEPLFAGWIASGQRQWGWGSFQDGRTWPSPPPWLSQSGWVVLIPYHEQDPWWQTIRNSGKQHHHQHHMKVTDGYAPTSDLC
jgi:hypothetical protein